MNNNFSFELGFVQKSFIYNLISLLINNNSVNSNDVYEWLDYKGKKTSVAENTLKLLLGAKILYEDGGVISLHKNYKALLENHSKERAFQTLLLNAFRVEDYELLISNGIWTGNLYIWSVDSFSPLIIPLRNLLTSFHILTRNERKIQSTDTLIKYFNNVGIISSKSPTEFKALSLEELMYSLEHKRELGRRAELAALDYENKRLGIEGILKPKIISEENVLLGYDIKSIDSSNSVNYDRFIEVKYFNNNHFYLSQNEESKAITLRNKYWIYLVNTQTGNIEMIQNPIEILSNDKMWVADCKVYEYNKVKS